MHPNAVLLEVQQLYNVSDRLDLLAERHPIVSEALVTISGSVRNLSDHFKSGQRLSLQNRPTGLAVRD
jgi:hypothetical protein